MASLETARVSEQPAMVAAKLWPAQQHRSLFAPGHAGLTSLSPHSYFPTTTLPATVFAQRRSQPPS